MNVFFKIICVCTLLLIIIGCNKDPKLDGAIKISQMERTSISEKILKQNKDADILCVYGARFYKRAEDQEKYRQVDLKKNHELGEVRKEYKNGYIFEDYMATKLQVGTKIFTIQGKMQSELLLVKLGEKYVAYVYEN
ncbi:hypothetical protein [Paenibacillus qinlingensis]|uniref:hypothetical protein n=1 Tax=Paenibacillus qinlingensis TaxID=1837343 RepID=UPI001567A4F6|nr:hypothetical protein [Paenibacillus qinlingensis]NQX61131.1 hypothetical protein [Paenibacillus qinlingensis]